MSHCPVLQWWFSQTSNPLPFLEQTPQFWLAAGSIAKGPLAPRQTLVHLGVLGVLALSPPSGLWSLS